jgi:hypothetical protein
VASRAEPTTGRLELPPAVSLGGAVRVALQSAYYHSWRLLPANVVWAVTAIAVLVGTLVTPVGLLLLPVLALPTAGLFRISTRITRGASVSFWDAIDAWRVAVPSTLAIGAAILLGTLILGTNVVIGLGGASPISWALATLAAWGLLAGWLFVWTFWPILVDPARSDRSVVERARLAALLVLARPLRIAALAAFLGVFLVVSTVAIVALVTISMALSALIASRYVLPAADRLEMRLAPDQIAPAPIGDMT